jgi:enoyl-CoA hydratase/carnithine racemase
MSDLVKLEIADHIATMTLNRPEIRNSISGKEMIDAIVGTVEMINGDPGIRCAILTGAGSAFCAGGNIKLIAAAKDHIDPSHPARIRLGYRTGIQRIPTAFEALEVPIIAVNGPAIGAGCDMTCMCDIRIAGTSARFAESFIRLGLIPGDGGAWLLPRVVGYSTACELAFTGETIDAEEALRIGLVSRVVPDGELLATARKLAGRIAANPPYALRMTKRLLRDGRHVKLDTALDMAASMQSLAHATKDHRRAIDAFVAKQTAVYTGE